MAEAVSVLLEHLVSVAGQEIQASVELVKEVDEEVRTLKTNFDMLRDVLADAEQRQVTDTHVRAWLENLKDVYYDTDEVLDTWNFAIMERLRLEGSNDAHTLKSKVRSAFLSLYSGSKKVSLSRDIVPKIKAITGSLDKIAKGIGMFNFKGTTTSTHQGVESTSGVPNVYGRGEEANNLVSKLLDENSKRQSDLHVISIVGMGGIGKTTLAQQAYNNEEVMNNFEKKIWVWVSNPFDQLMIAKAINEALGGDNSSVVKLESVIRKIRGLIAGKKFLLVLDDVWMEEEDAKQWEPFKHCLKNGLHGSKVLVTTRKRRTAAMMESIDIIPMDELSDEQCWKIFRRFAFFGWAPEARQELKEIGKKIASKCKGLPLAAKTLGRLLRSKENRTEWENILRSEIWKVEKFKEDVFPQLLLSYYDLPSMVKRCFTYCAIFPKDFIFEKNELIRLWMAQGYLNKDDEDEEAVGEKYFNILGECSLFQKFKKDEYKMHDIVHDVAQFLSNNECCMIDVDDLKNIGNTDPLCEKAYQLMLMVSGSEELPSLEELLTIEKLLGIEELPRSEELPISIYNFKKLRSLMIKSRNINCRLYIEPKLFEELTSLKALQMSDIGYIWHIPKEIGKLVHLRYLDLSQHSELIELSESLCELYNLQTLRIDGCDSLQTLPQGIGKLINLRHLINDGTLSLRYMPEGIGKLTKLRTLTEFHWSDGDYGRKACSLGCFNNIRHMESLCIKGLKDSRGVMDEFGQLKNNQNIRQLELGFSWFDGGWEELNHESIIEAFQLPPNLQRLTIEDYGGYSMSGLRLTSVTNLTSIFMIRCTKCLRLPLLGKLKFLETLYIDSMVSVTEVGNEFVGVERDYTSSSSSSSSSSVTFFPKLKDLQFQYMLEWEVWDFRIGDDTTVTFMPSLHTLKLGFCDKLKGLPKQLLDKAPLENLSIEGCPILERVYEKGRGDKWDHISHIPNVQITLTFP